MKFNKYSLAAIIAGTAITVTSTAVIMHILHEIPGSTENNSEKNSYKEIIKENLRKKYNTEFFIINIQENARNTWLEDISYSATVTPKNSDTEFTATISQNKKKIMDNYQKISFSEDIYNMISKIYADNDKIYVESSEYVFELTEQTWNNVDDYIRNSGSYINTVFKISGNTLDEVAEKISDFFNEIEGSGFSCIATCQFTTPAKEGTVSFASTSKAHPLGNINDILYKLENTIY